MHPQNPPTAQATHAAQAFNALADDVLLRVNDLATLPGRPGVLPVSVNSLWRWVKAGKFPAPIKLSPRCTVWRVGAVRAWLAAQQ